MYLHSNFSYFTSENTAAVKMMEMMRYLVETDYLSGSWMRTEEEPFAGIATAARALAHFRREFPRGPWTRRRGSTLSSQVYARVSRAHLRLNVFAYSSESSDVPCERQKPIGIFFSIIFQFAISVEKDLVRYHTVWPTAKHQARKQLSLSGFAFSNRSKLLV